MPSSTTNWSSAETWQRLVAAIVATGVKIDLHEVAKMYGTTYDTIQNRYRKIRAEADKLKKEVGGGAHDEIATPKKGTRSATSTPRKVKKEKDALTTVTNGRVSKSSPAKRRTKAVKEEGKDEEEEDIFADVDFGVYSGDVSMDGDEFTL